MEEIRTRLEMIQLRDVVVKSQNVLVLEHNLTVGEALKKLGKRKVLSAPLIISNGLEDLESLTPSNNGPSLLGWVDVNDILFEFLTHLHEGNRKLPTSMLQLMTELEKEGPLFANKMLITIAGGEDKSLLYQAETSTSLLFAIRNIYLKRRSNGRAIHRLALFDSYGTVTNILSQLDVIRYLVSHPGVLAEIAHESLETLGLVGRERGVVTIDPHMPAILAYDMMMKAGVTGAAIVSHEGALVAVLSTSDLRCIQPEHLGVLALPVAEFLALLHKTSYLGYSQMRSTQARHPFFAGSPPSPQSPRPCPRGSPPREEEDAIRCITCTAQSTLMEVLKLMVQNRVHRVFVVEPEAKPSEVVGVVTPTDVLELLAGKEEPEGTA